MPGIAGILNKRESSPARELLETMLETMMHETFYTKASYTNEKRGWYVGSVTPRGTLAKTTPARNRTGDILLFLSGECFLDRTTAGTHSSERTRTIEASVSGLLRLYEEHDDGFIESAKGLFSGILLDNRKGRALLFNDRYGVQRVYYYEDEENVYFASEAKALLRIVPELRAINPRSIAEYVCFDTVLYNNSFFRNVSLLPGGSIWILHRGISEKKQYFKAMDLERQPRLDLEDFSRELLRVFGDVLPLYLNGENLGIGVTGGQDTRLIMACLPDDRNHIRTYTFGGLHRDSLDVCLARKLARACELEHQVLRLDQEFLANFSEYAAKSIYLTDGLADVTNVDQLYLNRLVRDIAQIRVTGNFGSEVLGRSRRILRNRFIDSDLLSSDFREQVSNVSGALDACAQEHDLSFLLTKEIPWYWARFTVLEMSQLVVRTPYLDNDFINLLYRAPRMGFNGDTWEIESVKRKNRKLLNIPTNRGVGGRGCAPRRALVAVLYRSMAMMDKALNWDVLPYSLHHNVTRIDSLMLTPLHLNRVALGYAYFHHYNIWFRNELASYVKEMLLDERTLRRPYWNARRLRKIVNDHVSGRRRYLLEIRKVLTIELIHRTLVEDRR